MAMKLFVIIIILFITFNNVSAKLTEDAKERYLTTSERHKYNATITQKFLTVVNQNVDLSEDTDVRQKLIENAAFAGVDVNQFPNILRAPQQKNYSNLILLIAAAIILVAGVLAGWWYGRKKHLVS